MKQNRLFVLGASDWRPDSGNDHSCCLQDGHILIDCCSGALMTLIDHGYDPAKIDLILLTHLHPDHFLGLASLLHYQRTRKRALEEIVIAGPAETLEEAVRLSTRIAFYGHEDLDTAPTLLPLKSGEARTCAGYRLRTLAAHHSVPGLCYRIDDPDSGCSLGYSGDTMVFDDMIPFFRDVDLLVHEATFGSEPLPAFNLVCRHSNAHDALKTARACRAKQLLLIHAGANRQKATQLPEDASCPVQWAVPGKEYVISRELIP